MEEASSSFCRSAAKSRPTREFDEPPQAAKVTDHHRHRKEIEGEVFIGEESNAGHDRDAEKADPARRGDAGYAHGALVIGSARAVSRATSVRTSVTMAK